VLRREAHAAIEDPLNEVFVSAVTPWEIEIKRASRGLRAPADLASEFRRAGFTPLPVTWEHGLAAGALPPLHRDPFDRMLVAQARLEGLTIVTRDERVAAYDVPVLTA